MKVILLDKVARLGSVGTEVEVKAGYARNYLLPKKLAVLATPANRAFFETKRAELEATAAAKLAEAQSLAQQLSELDSLEIGVTAGNEGRLFGSVSNRDVAALLEVYGINLDKSAIRVPNGHIREIGEHTVRVHLHSDVNVDLVINVTAA